MLVGISENEATSVSTQILAVCVPEGNYTSLKMLTLKYTLVSSLVSRQNKFHTT